MAVRPKRFTHSLHCLAAREIFPVRGGAKHPLGVPWGRTKCLFATVTRTTDLGDHCRIIKRGRSETYE